MASSAHKQQQQLPNMYGATPAPPPTPSIQPNNHLATSSAAADVLSSILLRLPPTLSLPTRRNPPAACTPPPLISLSDKNPNFDAILSSSTQLGFFQLTNHDIPSQLAHSAESESLALFELTTDQKETCFPKNWPLGYDADDEEGGDGTRTQSFCLDATCSTESTELSLSSLRQFTRAAEKVGLKVVEMIASAVGFENPIGNDPTRFFSLMWVYEGLPGDKIHKPVMSGGFYPYVVGLQYQIRYQQYLLLADSGWVSVSPQVDSVLVTLGDIAQVWSNGKVKKVRGRPVATFSGDGSIHSHCISMSLLVTLPMDTRVSPLLPKLQVDTDTDVALEIEGSSSSAEKEEDERLFRSFSFEDYAWRVYHERLLFKDPLDRYRT